MSAKLSRLASEHPRRIGLLAAVVFIAAAVLGSSAPGSFSAPNAFDDPGSESAHARERIEAATGESAETAIIAVVDAPPGSARVKGVAGKIGADPGIARVTAPAGPRSPLVSRDGESVLVAATIEASASNDDTAERLLDSVGDEPGVTLGGTAVAGAQVNEQATSDLATGELLAFPVLAILLFVFFRGVAALLPLAVGATTVLGTFAILRAVNELITLSPFALNLVIGAGLGLSIDYSLLTVSRFREEMGQGSSPPRALLATLRQSGHTVIFSAVTVSAALVCLTVFPQRFLISMGIGGALVALVAAAATMLVLPPLLILLAGRLGKVTPKPEGEGRWYALSNWTMKRPVAVAICSALLMLVLALPTLNLQWIGVDASALPSDQSARAASERVDADFPGASSSPVTVAITAPGDAKAEVDAYARQLAALRGAAAVPPPTYVGSRTWRLQVNTGAEPSSDAGRALTDAVRAAPAPFPVEVGGVGAVLEDSQAAVSAALPLALALLVALTLVALWLMSGSVVLPIKSLVMNFLSLASATGILVFVFQDGHLNGLIGAERQNGIEQADYLVLAAIVFGLSTDYGVFLISRIREERERGRENREAIAAGVQRTGTVVSAAAILLAVALGAFVTSGLAFLKELGLGASLAVLLDAFVVRALLAPSLMALFGEFNWWQPRLLARLHRRLDPLASEIPARPVADSGPRGEVT